MPGQKQRLKFAGVEVEVEVVPVTKSTAYFNECQLADGSLLRVKGVATSILRMEGQHGPDGKPIYIVTISPVVSVDSAPDELMKKSS